MGPDLSGKTFDKRSNQKSRMYKGSKEREFTIGTSKPKRLDGTVTEQTASLLLSSRRRSTLEVPS